MDSAIHSYRSIGNTNGYAVFEIHTAITDFIIDVADNFTECFLQRSGVFCVKEVITDVLGAAAGIGICAAPSIGVVRQRTEIVCVRSTAIVFILCSISSKSKNVVERIPIINKCSCVVRGSVPCCVRITSSFRTSCI